MSDPRRRPAALCFASALLFAAIASAQTDGTQDAGFISNGKYAYQSVVDGNFRIWDVAVSPTDLVVVADGRGRITVAGRSFEDADGPSSDFLLVRYLSDGQDDLSFGTTENGEVRVAFDLVADGDDIARGLAFHQGHLVMGGEAERSSGSKLAALRLHVNLIFADGFEAASTIAW